MLKRKTTLSEVVVSLLANNCFVVKIHGLSNDILLLPETLLPLNFLSGFLCLLTGINLHLGSSGCLFGSFLCFLLFMKNFHLLNFFFFGLLLFHDFHISFLLLEFSLLLTFTFISLHGLGRWRWDRMETFISSILLIQLLSLFSMSWWSLVINDFLAIIFVELCRRLCWLIESRRSFGAIQRWGSGHDGLISWLFRELLDRCGLHGHALSLYSFRDNCLFWISSSHFFKF